jgi:hypothetical protein
VVTFQCGGVNQGKFPSSIPLPKKTKDYPTKLGKDFQEYEIALSANQLTNVVDPFCMVASALDNPGKPCRWTISVSRSPPRS